MFDLLSLCNRLLSIASLTVEVLNLIIREKLINCRVKVLITFNLAWDIDKRFQMVSAHVTNLTANVGPVLTLEKILNEILTVCSLKSLLNSIEKDTVKLLDVLLLATFTLRPSKRLSQSLS